MCAGECGLSPHHIAVTFTEASAARKSTYSRRGHVTISNILPPQTHSRFSELFPLSMDNANVHETLQDSLDVVSVVNSMNITSTQLCSARIGAFIHHGTITSTGEFGTFNHPNICSPRRLSNITRLPVTSEYLRVQR